ncbi:MAG: MFS transporter [Bacteroidota bacterium]
MLHLSNFINRSQIRAGGIIFVSHGLIMASWIVYIPYVKENLGLSEGAFGRALFFMALGAFSSMLLSSRIIRQWGEGAATFWMTLGMALSVSLPIMASTYVQLCASLFVFGACSGLQDIAMNALVAEIERRQKILIMSASHGFFSLGAMLGTGLGSPLAALWKAPLLHILLSSALLILIQVLIRNTYYAVRVIEDNSSEQKQISWVHAWLLLPLIIMAGFTMMGEGAIADWSAIYLNEVNQAPEWSWGMGYAGFSLAMTLGRFQGDVLSKQLSSVMLTRLAFLVSALGAGILLLNSVVFSILGFVLMGIGFSVIVPELFRRAANQSAIASTQGLAAVAGAGYFGFLIGPVLLGYLAETYSLFFSFGLLLALNLISFLVAGFRT